MHHRQLTFTGTGKADHRPVVGRKDRRLRRKVRRAIVNAADLEQPDRFDRCGVGIEIAYAACWDGSAGPSIPGQK